MSNLANWFKEHEHLFTSEDIQLLKDFIDGSIKPGPTAKSLTKNINMRKNPNTPFYCLSATIISLAIYSFDSAIQKKLIKLASEIQNPKKNLLNLGDKTLPHQILGGAK